MGKTFDATQDQRVKDLDAKIENAKVRLAEISAEQAAEQVELEKLNEALMQMMFDKKPEKDKVNEVVVLRGKIAGRADVLKMVKSMHEKAELERSLLVNGNKLAEAKVIKEEAWKKTINALAKLEGAAVEFGEAYDLVLSYGNFIPGTHKCYQQQGMLAQTHNLKSTIIALLNSYRNIPTIDEIRPINPG